MISSSRVSDSKQNRLEVCESKQNMTQSTKEQFRIKINKNIYSCPREKTSSSEFISKITSSRKTNLEDPGAKSNFHEKRRESHLNSLFRIRKQKLQSITKFNRGFYARLNNQQSHYMPKSPTVDKNQGQEHIFTFRTIDSRQSRQILGPIRNFNSRMALHSKQKIKGIHFQKQNEENLRKISTSRNLQSSQFDEIKPLCQQIKHLATKMNPQSGIYNTPLRRKLFGQSQFDCDVHSQSRSMKLIKSQFQSKQSGRRPFMKTPQKVSKLPDLYFFV